MQTVAQQRLVPETIAARHRFSVAPMMDCTDRHYRYLARLISSRALLYTEMLTSGAVLFGDAHKLLGYQAFERPLVLQLGGSDPAAMAASARIAAQWGYDEVNINVGCPSDRVQSGMFGACLMKQPRRVADCVKAMRDAVDMPVTVKHRIGVDDQDSQQALHEFVAAVAGAGCDAVIIHARKAWLQGLSPRQNRDVPPLDYPAVHGVKRAFPGLTVVINGGLTDLDSAAEQLQYVDGVMLGRQAYANPYLLAGVDRRFFGDTSRPRTRTGILEAYTRYAAIQLEAGVPLHRLTRHVIGLFQGCRGARAWRRYLSEHAHEKHAGLEVMERAAALVTDPDA